MSERHERDFHHPEPGDCPTWGLWVLAFALILFSHFAGAQTQPWFTASVSNGISPVSTTFTWTCPAGSVSAIATSPGNQTAWTGAKAASGSQNLTGIKLTASYKIDCLTAAGTTVSSTLTWVLPTTNTDGSVLTNLAGTRVSWGTSPLDVPSFELHAVKIADPKATTYTFAGLPTGLLYYAAKAYTATGVESTLSTQITKTGVGTPGQTFSASVTITVDTQPAPPVLSTVDTTAYSVNKATDALALNAVGTVALGVSCKPEYDANGLNVVPRNLVKFKTATKPLVVVAKCG